MQKRFIVMMGEVDSSGHLHLHGNSCKSRKHAEQMRDNILAEGKKMGLDLPMIPPQIVEVEANIMPVPEPVNN